MAANIDAAGLAKAIDTLRRMTVKTLRRRHVELFGEESRAGNRQYLFPRIASRMQALAEGDLTERARRRAQELARDADLRRRPPRELVMPPAPADLRTVTGRLAVSRDDRLPMPGATLKRVVKGHECQAGRRPERTQRGGLDTSPRAGDPEGRRRHCRPPAAAGRPRANHAFAADREVKNQCVRHQTDSRDLRML
jgi:hypothetical protein